MAQSRGPLVGAALRERLGVVFLETFRTLSLVDGLKAFRYSPRMSQTAAEKASFKAHFTVTDSARGAAVILTAKFKGSSLSVHDAVSLLMYEVTSRA